MKYKIDIFTIFAGLAITVSVVCLSISVFGRVDVKEVKEEEHTVYIVYMDDQSQPYAIPTIASVGRKTVPLADAERDKIASIVAGKSGSKPVSVQLMVANVVLNDIMHCHGSIENAVSRFQLDTYKTPTDDQYEVVDAVFERGELSLDDDVLYMRASGEKSSFHDGLTFVCEYFGISFYKEG